MAHVQGLHLVAARNTKRACLRGRFLCGALDSSCHNATG
ncbi:hypothetical protein DLM_4001 [Aquitalea magnusonii]|uniref:Uncharacterized protein n=1 Tax=Aquitalea magnusonii TaxID=332411 RepID=A0A3G9GI74_9NEIS|nr:hypothetical protein DLM_4001 [Aquitalea magnusonii]